MPEERNTQSIEMMATLLLMQTWQARLRDYMKAKGLKQADLAKRLGMTQGGVGHWLTTRNNITLKQFQRLCHAAGANAQVILFGTEPTGPELINQIRKLVADQSIAAPLSSRTPEIRAKRVKPPKKRPKVTPKHLPRHDGERSPT